MLALEIPRRSHTENLGWLLLVLGLDHLARVMEAGDSLRSPVACLIGFRKL